MLPNQTPGTQEAAPAEQSAEKAPAPVVHTNCKTRLMKDFRKLQSSSESLGISARLCNGDLFHWRAVISGPEDTAWEGGLYKLELHFTEGYPLTPPEVKFLTRVLHPNVYVNGKVCMDTLKQNWSPSLDVETLLLSVQSLLTDPNPNSAANAEASEQITKNPNDYYRRVKQLAEESLNQDFSCSDDEDSS